MEAADSEGLQSVEAINPHDRHTMRSGVRSAMRAASQLSQRGPTDVDVCCTCTLIKNKIVMKMQSMVTVLKFCTPKRPIK